MKHKKTLLRATLFIILLCVLSLQAKAASKTILRDYPVPEHGVLRLAVPEEWNVTYHEPADKPSPIIIFYPQEKPHAFQLTLSPLWDNGIDRDIGSLAFIKDYVEKVGANILNYSVEEELLLEKIEGQQGEGYFFQLTDNGTVQEDEFKYLLQGALAVSDLLLVFSYFSKTKTDENLQAVQEMLETAIQQHQRHVHFLSR